MKLLLILLLVFVNGTHILGTKYGFYKDMDRNALNARRLFGGQLANLDEFPAVAILLDRFWSTRCSGAVITPYWALTAAHCVTARLAFVKYNSKQPKAPEGDIAAILYLYRHPEYKVIQEDEGRGMDVTLLHHDIGLIRTRDQMKLKTPLLPLSAMKEYAPGELLAKELTVLGYGNTNVPTRTASEELFAVSLLTTECERDTWFHCLCGVSGPGREQRGVCSGDSGGPVVYKNVQVGVTSMGPLDCSSTRSNPPETATSVFTSTYYYVDLINTTIHDAEKEAKMVKHNDDKSKVQIIPYRSVAMFLKVHIPLIFFSIFAMVL